jgi:hypothetical protein
MAGRDARQPAGHPGQRPRPAVPAGGSKVESQAVYFARGSQVVQAVIYADQVPAEAADTFFAGLGFE